MFIKWKIFSLNKKPNVENALTVIRNDCIAYFWWGSISVLTCFSPLSLSSVLNEPTMLNNCKFEHGTSSARHVCHRHRSQRKRGKRLSVRECRIEQKPKSSSMMLTAHFSLNMCYATYKIPHEHADKVKDLNELNLAILSQLRCAGLHWTVVRDVAIV